jgi:hypothetical protein
MRSLIRPRQRVSGVGDTMSMRAMVGRDVGDGGVLGCGSTILGQLHVDNHAPWCDGAGWSGSGEVATTMMSMHLG